MVGSELKVPLVRYTRRLDYLLYPALPSSLLSSVRVYPPDTVRASPTPTMRDHLPSTSTVVTHMPRSLFRANTHVPDIYLQHMILATSR